MATFDGASTPAEGWQEGMNLLTAGKPAEAIAVLQHFVQNQPDSFEGHNYLGVAWAQNQRFEEAIVSLQKATALNSKSAQAHYNLGLAFEGANRMEAARREFQSALQLDPKYAAATHALSRLDAGASTPWQSGEAVTQPFGSQPQDTRSLARPRMLNIFGGLVAGLIAAVMCAVIWDKVTYYTHFQFGYAAIGVGYAVGTAVVLGAGQKRGRSLQFLGALLALFGILLGETLLVMDYVRDEIAKDPTLSYAGDSPIGLYCSQRVLHSPIVQRKSDEHSFRLVGTLVRLGRSSYSKRAIPCRSHRNRRAAGRCDCGQRANGCARAHSEYSGCQRINGRAAARLKFQLPQKAKPNLFCASLFVGADLYLVCAFPAPVQKRRHFRELQFLQPNRITFLARGFFARRDKFRRIPLFLRFQNIEKFACVPIFFSNQSTPRRR